MIVFKRNSTRPPAVYQNKILKKQCVFCASQCFFTVQLNIPFSSKLKIRMSLMVPEVIRKSTATKLKLHGI